MESHLGLPPEEMISIFNQMYKDVWERLKEQVPWDDFRISANLAEGKDLDLSLSVTKLVEMAMTAARDAALLTMYYNNEKIHEELRSLGIELPERESALAEEG